jgi:hypothetical protein
LAAIESIAIKTTEVRRLNVHDFGVTTRRNRLSPVDLRVVTGAKSSGDAKSDRSQSFNKDVTKVTNVTTYFEKGAASALPADCPRNGRQFGKS